MVRRVHAATFMIALCLPLLGTRRAEADPFRYPVDVVAAENGTLYVADPRLPGIWKVTDGNSEVFVEASPKFRTPLNGIRCLALDANGALLAGDSATREVYRVSASGELEPLTDGRIGIPICLAVDAKGTIFVSDLESQRIWRVSAGGGDPEVFAVLAAVRGMAFDAEGDLWVVRGLTPCLGKVRTDGTLEPVLDQRTFRFPHQLTIGGDGALYVADGYAKCVWKVAPNGNAEAWISGKPLVSPVGLAWRGEELLIADPRANALFSAAQEGKLNRVFPAEEPH